MTDKKFYTVFILDGDFFDFHDDPDAQVITFADLTVDEVLMLMHLALGRGLQVIVKTQATGGA